MADHIEAAVNAAAERVYDDGNERLARIVRPFHFVTELLYAFFCEFLYQNDLGDVK
jgi:hypothetical protein